MENIINDLKTVQDFLDKGSDLQKTLIKGKAIIEDFIGGNNMWNMLLLNPEEATDYWKNEVTEIYQLFDDGETSLIETEEDFEYALEVCEWFGVKDDY